MRSVSLRIFCIRRGCLKRGSLSFFTKASLSSRFAPKIPIDIAGALLLVKLWGGTINLMTMIGLIVMVGASTSNGPGINWRNVVRNGSEFIFHTPGILVYLQEERENQIAENGVQGARCKESGFN